MAGNPSLVKTSHGMIQGVSGRNRSGLAVRSKCDGLVSRALLTLRSFSAAPGFTSSHRLPQVGREQGRQRDVLSPCFFGVFDRGCWGTCRDEIGTK